jgi:predicted ATPase
VPTAPVLVVLTYRPDFHPPWEARSHVAPLLVSRLTRSQATQLIERLAGRERIPGPKVQEIVRKTDGVPLFVEEVTRALLEAGAFAGEEGDRSIATSELAIPATLQDSLMARLDRLGAAKEVAQLAATLGREFSYELLHAVAPLEESSLQAALRQLGDAEFLYQRGLTPEASYTFRHALIQETAYQSLLKSRRREVHEQIARVLEERFSEVAEKQPERIAHHYTEANLNQKAIGYWQRAGQRAVERSANLEAIHHLDKGLELLRTLPETPERNQQELSLRMPRTSALIASQGYGANELERNLIRAREVCQELGESPLLGPILWALAVLHMVRGRDWEAVSELNGELFELAERASDATLQLAAHTLAGNLSFNRGEHLRAREHLTQALHLYDPEQHRSLGLIYGQHPALNAYAWAAWNLQCLGYPDQAWKTAQKALAEAKAASYPLGLATVLSLAAAVRILRREPKACRELTERSLALSTEQEFPYFLAAARMSRAWAIAQEGQAAAAISEIQEGLSVWRTLGVGMYVQTFLGRLAEVYLKEGMAEPGLAAIDQARSAVRHVPGFLYEPELHRLKGELLLLDEEDPAEPESCFQRALEVAREQGAKLYELRAAMSLARLWQSQGKQKQARELLAPVYDWFTEGFDLQDLQDAKALLEELRHNRRTGTARATGSRPPE